MNLPKDGVISLSLRYTNSSLDIAISIMAGIPKGRKDNSAAIDPAIDHGQLFLFIASIPPTIATNAITSEGMGRPKIMLGTNGGISPLPKPLPASPKPMV